MSSLQEITQPLVANQFYHIFNRGNGGQRIFLQERNYEHFLSKYKNYMLDYWDTYAYALLPNHFHLMIKVKSEKVLLEVATEDFTKVSKSFVNKWTPNPDIPPTDLLNFKNLVNLTRATPKAYANYFLTGDPNLLRESLLQWVVSERFRRFLLSYAKAIRSQEGDKGSLFQKLFRRKRVDDLNYQKQLVLYLHRNYIHHGYAVDLSDDNWTSYNSMRSDRPTSLARQEVLHWFGGSANFQQVHERYADEWSGTQKWKIEED
ncbi:MAG: hypothetical protein AAF849_22155 [Bacteroidota bacterium]